MINMDICMCLLRIAKSTWADLGLVIFFIGLVLLGIGFLTLIASLFVESRKKVATLGLKILLGGLLLAIGGGATFCSNFSLGSMQ